MANTPKHAVICPTAASVANSARYGRVQTSSKKESELALLIPRSDREKGEMIYARSSPPGTYKHLDLNLQSAITITGIDESVERSPAIQVIDRCLKETGIVLGIIEQKALTEKWVE